VKGERSLPRGTQFRSVSDLYAEPERWDVVLDQGADSPAWRRYSLTSADKFLRRTSGTTASLVHAPAAMLVLVVERNDAS